jgi:uncharacterized membrane protein
VRLIFWLFSAALIAVVTHLSYVLFVPASNFNDRIDAALKEQKLNQFTILDGKLQTKLMPFVSDTDLVILCKYDISQGPVRLSMRVPDGYWTLSVYTMHGRQAYALNDRQADARAFSVRLTKARSFFDQLTSIGEDDANFEDIGWKVELPEDKGLAFLWMPHADKWRRTEDLAEIGNSKCEEIPKE